MEESIEDSQLGGLKNSVFCFEIISSLRCQHDKRSIVIDNLDQKPLVMQLTKRAIGWFLNFSILRTLLSYNFKISKEEKSW